MNNKIDILFDSLIPVGALVGISQIESIIGIILLVLQIILILYKGIYKVVMKIKNKNYKGISSDIQETINALEDLKESESEKNEWV